jgi:site-specific DNA recombinase
LGASRLTGAIYIHDLAAAWQSGTITRAGDDEETVRKITECDRKLAQYRATLDAGANPATVATWIAETEAEKARYQLAVRPAPARTRMSEAEIKAVVDKLADIARVLQDADPDDKAEIFRQLGLKLTYHPRRQLVEAQVEVPQHWQMESVRGASRTLRT